MENKSDMQFNELLKLAKDAVDWGNKITDQRNSLLEALNELLMSGVFHNTSDDTRASKAIELANKAIAKAEGKAS